MSLPGRLGLLLLALAAALGLTLEYRHRATEAESQGIATLRTHRFGGTTRGRLDHFLSVARPHARIDYQANASGLLRATQVILTLNDGSNQERYTFEVSDQVRPADPAAERLVEAASRFGNGAEVAPSF